MSVGERYQDDVISSNLTGDTSYTFTMVVTYPRDPLPGICSESVIVNRHTPEGVPTSRPLNVSARGHDSMLVLTWLPPAEWQCNGNISHYLVSISNSTGDVASTGGSVAGKTSYSYLEYSPALNYSYSVAACTSKGCGPSYQDVLLSHPDIGSSTPISRSRCISS